MSHYYLRIPERGIVEEGGTTAVPPREEKLNPKEESGPPEEVRFNKKAEHGLKCQR
jgi:hypothetical protein